MKEKKSSNKRMQYLDIGVSLVGLLLFILACVAKNPVVGALCGALAVLAIIVGCVLLYLTHKRTATMTNFFPKPHVTGHPTDIGTSCRLSAVR